MCFVQSAKTVPLLSGLRNQLILLREYCAQKKRPGSLKVGSFSSSNDIPNMSQNLSLLDSLYAVQNLQSLQNPIITHSVSCRSSASSGVNISDGINITSRHMFYYIFCIVYSDIPYMVHLLLVQAQTAQIDAQNICKSIV